MDSASLRALLLANPAAAMDAVRHLKIAGPRVSLPGGRMAIDGKTVATVYKESRWFADLPRGFGHQTHAAKGEDPEALAARVDTTWRAAGWILVDTDDDTIQEVRRA